MPLVVRQSRPASLLLLLAIGAAIGAGLATLSPPARAQPSARFHASTRSRLRGSATRRISRALPRPSGRDVRRRRALRRTANPSVVRAARAATGERRGGGGQQPAVMSAGQSTATDNYEPAEQPAGEASDEPAELTPPSEAEAEEATEADEPGEEPLNASASEGSEELPEEQLEGQRKNEGELPSDEGETTIDPSDRRFLTYLPFGTRSFWVQPWRAYLDTWPASRLLNALGINFSAVGPQTEAIAQLLKDSGFRLARKGISWDALTYADPTKFRDEPRIRASLTSLHAHGLRPLIVLDANSEAPTPMRHIKLETIGAAPAGAQTVKLTATSAAQVIDWKSGFNGLTFGGSPDDLITSVNSNDVATLSRPLPNVLAAGLHGGSTLRYAPFATPLFANGSPDPMFQETLAGWLSYVAAVCHEAASVVGPGNYDLEVWNELTFGSQFLNIEHYESAPSPATIAQRRANNKLIRKAILRETVAFVRNPANGISPSVGITDGFASQSPFSSGADAPIGLTALSKHPYVGARQFPANYLEQHITPIDALGARDAPKHSFTPNYVPTYQSLFPEYTITGSSTETLIRDVAPFTTYVYGYPHGRFVHAPGGEPVEKWITEFNMSTGRGVPMAPDGITPESSVTLSAADRTHFQAKALLRDLVAMVGKGFSRDYFFHASPHSGYLNLVSQEFLSAAEQHPGSYPPDALGGEILTGLRNLMAPFQGPGPSGAARQLKLLSITQSGNHAQFGGDGTAAHPPLYDRDVLAVLPFQSSPTRFVIPVYVMTRDLLTLYRPQAPSSEVSRFDLPDENFQITLGNLPESSAQPTVSAYDPLRNQSTPARLVSREGGTGVFEFAATDYPRLLTIDFAGS